MNLFGKKKQQPSPLSNVSVAPPGFSLDSDFHSDLTNAFNAVDAITQISAQLTILEKREHLMNQRIHQALVDATAKKQKGDTKGAKLACPYSTSSSVTRSVI